MCFAICDRGVFCAYLFVPYSFECGIFGRFSVLVILIRHDTRSLQSVQIFYDGRRGSLGGGHYGGGLRCVRDRFTGRKRYAFVCCDEWFVSPCRHLCREFSLTGRTASSKTRRQCGRAEEWRSKLGGKSLHIWLIQSHSPRGKRMGILHLPVDVISICILFACNIEQSLLWIGGFKALSARLCVGHIHCCSSQIFQSPSIDSPFSIVSKEHPSNLPCKMSEMTTSNEEVSIGSK